MDNLAKSALKDDSSSGVMAVMYSVGDNAKVLFKIAGTVITIFYYQHYMRKFKQ